MATWARSRPDALTVTGETIRAREITVRPPPGRPGHGLLLGTGWHACPGSEWREADFAPGVWEVAVFAFSTGPVSLGNREQTFR
jgi:hypothetical protein